MAGHRLVVIGSVLVGGAIHVTTGLVDDAHVLLITHMLGSLEHHVLEEVREAGLAHRLAGGTDVIGHIQVNQGIRVIRRQDHSQAIIQLVHLVGDGELSRRLGLLGDQGWRSQEWQADAEQYAEWDEFVHCYLLMKGTG